MRRGWAYGAALLVTLVGLAPILSVILSSGIANAYGCVLNEGGANPCFVSGVDIGGALVTMFVAGWFFFLTWPLALGGIGMGVVLGLIDLVRWVRSR